MFNLSFKNKSYSLVFGIMFFTITLSESFQSISRNILEEQNEASDIIKLFDHAKASLQSLETFADGVKSFELVLAQPEVVNAIKYSNTRNTSPSITKLYLPSKVLTVCKEICSFYKKNMEMLKAYSERISDVFAVVGDLWPTAPMNELLKKQNLITWANEIYKKERVVAKPQQAEKTVEKQNLPKEPAVTALPSESKNQEQTETVQKGMFTDHRDAIVQIIKNGVTRKKKGSTCPHCKSQNIPTKSPSVETKIAPKTVTRRNDYESRATSAEKAGHLPPWMQKQSISNTQVVPVATVDNSTFSKPKRVSNRRKNVEGSVKQDFVADPDSLKRASDSEAKAVDQNTKKSAPSDVTGPVIR